MANKKITANEAATLMKTEKDYRILDVRTAEEYEERHIPGAINIPNEIIGADVVSQLPDKEQMLLVHCHSGVRSKQASKKLVELGYKKVLDFGGIIDWKGETVTENP